VKPLDQLYPEEFKGRLGSKQVHAYAAMHFYDWIYGSIVKFGPEGGAIWFGPGWLANSSPLNYEGFRAGTNDSGLSTISDLKTTGGALTGTTAAKPATLLVPLSSLDANVTKKIAFRLKNDSDGTQAIFSWHLVGEKYGAPSSAKTIPIKPNSDFTEYTFDLVD